MSGMPVAADRVARFVEMTSVEREAATLDEMFQRMTSVPDGVVGVQPEGLPAICQAWGVPYGRVLTWLMGDANRYGVYERALAVASHALIAETVEIADNDSPATQRDRLRVDTRFRVARHHAPDKYGERVEVTHTERMEVVLETPASDLLKLVRRSETIDVTPEVVPLDAELDDEGI